MGKFGVVRVRNSGVAVVEFGVARVRNAMVVFFVVEFGGARPRHLDLGAVARRVDHGHHERDGA